MSLPSDLLTQAKFLLEKEPKRPKRASLRRSVSTAYYALFHLLVEDGALVMFGGSDATELRNIVRRAYVHSTMKQAAKSFGSGQPARAWSTVLPHPSTDLTLVAQTFVDLQEARHQADYEPGYRSTRSEARDLFERTESAFAAWKRIRKDRTKDTFSLEARVFLAAILVHKQVHY